MRMDSGNRGLEFGLAVYGHWSPPATVNSASIAWPRFAERHSHHLSHKDVAVLVHLEQVPKCTVSQVYLLSFFYAVYFRSSTSIWLSVLFVCFSALTPTEAGRFSGIWSSGRNRFFVCLFKCQRLRQVSVQARGNQSITFFPDPDLWTNVTKIIDHCKSTVL